MCPIDYTTTEDATNFDGNTLFLETKLQTYPQAGNITLRKGKRQIRVEEVVPDSEEDREPQQGPQLKEVIVISSSDEEQEEDEVEAALIIKAPNVVLPGSWPSDSEDEQFGKVPVKHCFRTPQNRRRFPAARRVIQSSDSESSEPVSPIRPPKKPSAKKSVAEEVIEITSSSENEIQPLPSFSSSLSKTNQASSSQVNLPPYLTQEDDGAVLIFNEPKSARKPLRVSTTKRRTTEGLRDIDAIEKADGPPPIDTIKGHVLRDSPSINSPAFGASASQSTSRRKPNKRISKKALEEAERARREEYANELFLSLNSSVFKNGLPQETRLTWNNRLLSTAGRAKYRRSRDGTETAEIELATKILDCDERIRNTLSHEMCHLATWVINKKLDENHGKLFKHWASKVTRKRSDIEITTKHNYEISYPYKWQCQKCQKIYGRYSKSIRPDECVCGACREGRLFPLFTVRSKAQTPKISRQAAGNFQDSPCSLPRPAKAPSELTELEEITYISDIDADIEALTLTMDKTYIV